MPLGNVELSSSVLRVEGRNECNGLYVTSRPAGDNSSRAAGRRQPGHGIRMRTCSNPSRTWHDMAEGGRVHRQTRSAAEGGRGVHIHYSFYFPLVLGVEQSRPASRLPACSFQPEISMFMGWSKCCGRMGIQMRSPGRLILGPAGMLRSNRRGGRGGGLTVRAQPL